ncbi:DNA-binding protein [Dysgonomonas sp. 521]|uniref:helix-turn-helix domain-containing protein n=1 Tax=Dysgonomonas sp. 521 TaxID=2302932 RepID=UPI0013D86F65|nr:helix-turn-helix domain-containing protein [Dysgonomonas sp. 521]NDV97617.1 DNA-binding protein [Dysgonomonas sp. 521]
MEINDNKFDDSMDKILAILEELSKLMKARNRLNGENIYDNQDLCVMLKLSKRSLQRLRSLGLLPYLQIGQKTFYLESDVMRYIQNQIDNRKNLNGNGNDGESP